MLTMFTVEKSWLGKTFAEIHQCYPFLPSVKCRIDEVNKIVDPPCDRGIMLVFEERKYRRIERFDMDGVDLVAGKMPPQKVSIFYTTRY